MGLIEKNFPAIGSYGTAADVNELSTNDGCSYCGNPGSHPEANTLPAQEFMQVEEDDHTLQAQARQYLKLPKEGTATPTADMSAREVIRTAEEDDHQTLCSNRCMRQPFPQMQGMPMPIITDPSMKLIAVHRLVPMPLHWIEKAKKDLDQDVHLGIIEPVPINTPTSWCSRKVIVPKSSGEPRRTMDFKALNVSIRLDIRSSQRHCPRCLELRVSKRQKMSRILNLDEKCPKSLFLQYIHKL